MQTKGQWMRSRNWKVVGALAATSALGIVRIAGAADAQPPIEPEPIRLNDTTNVSEVTNVSTVPSAPVTTTFTPL